MKAVRNNLVTRRDVLPGLCERTHIKLQVEGAAELFYVKAGCGPVETMKEHSLLHGREWIDVCNWANCFQQCVQTLLIQLRQRKVGGRIATTPGDRQCSMISLRSFAWVAASRSMVSWQ
jgi:hypothetical protein